MIWKWQQFNWTHLLASTLSEKGNQQFSDCSYNLTVKLAHTMKTYIIQCQKLVIYRNHPRLFFPAKRRKTNMFPQLSVWITGKNCLPHSTFPATSSGNTLMATNLPWFKRNGEPTHEDYVSWRHDAFSQCAYKEGLWRIPKSSKEWKHSCSVVDFWFWE